MESTLTGPDSPGAVAVPPKETVIPVGMMTLATLERSGTAPPAQFAGSSQSPVEPPIQVTVSSREMLAVVFAVSACSM